MSAFLNKKEKDLLQVRVPFLEVASVQARNSLLNSKLRVPFLEVREMTMTREMAEKYIKWSIAGDSEDRFRCNDHLHLVLSLMYYSHLKPVYIYRLRLSDVKENANGSGNAEFVTLRGGEYSYYVSIRKEEMDELKAYIKKYNVQADSPIIQVGERNIRKVFGEIAAVYRESGKPPAQLKEVYFAGLTIE